MSRHTYAFPYGTRTRLAGGINRLMRRWQRGGIEQYDWRAGTHAIPGAPRLQRVWGYDVGIEVSEHAVMLPGLPEAFRSLRIAHLTDIHHGLFLPLQAVVDAVELVNQMRPDVVALTGDFVTYSRAYIEPVAEVLGTLQPRCGIFAVLGNHDFRVGAEAITRALRKRGIDVLRNRHSVIRAPSDANGDLLHIAGIDDINYRADLPRSLRGIPHGAATVLLSHNPRIIRRAARSGVGLVLSGHTHGGQVKLPLVGSIYGRSPERLRFKSGMDGIGDTRIYVSRGIGTVVLPLRYRCPAEIPVFDLHPATAERMQAPLRQVIH